MSNQITNETTETPQYSKFDWPEGLPKLSELILEGSKLTPKFEGDYEGILPDGTVGTCAIGAAAYAARERGLHNHEYFTRSALYHAWGYMIQPFDRKVPWPEGVVVDDPLILKHNDLYNVITYLNDTAGWTREQIAAYVAEWGY